ncbi:MAG: prepilin-type N-terminal cleavage/methylation domain-containing protein [Bacilli bacterium]|nr:prepilin-type N-terminal cleavage/methylation domain-containing protein [Bacilli bacterium]
MKKNRKKAFTLVELLAVIVILAVILIIAIPQIMNTIKSTRLKSMESSARLIVTNAEKDYLSQQAINQNYNAASIPCSDVAKLNDDYSSCSITYNSNGVQQ